jgi:fatty acid desaturase
MRTRSDNIEGELVARMSDGDFLAFVRSRGLLEPQTGYYVGLALLTLGLLAASLACLAWVDAPSWQLLNAILLAFVFGQIGVIGHDADHGQVFRSARCSDAVGVAVTFFTGLERSWWRTKHSAHHRAPNQQGLDPDLEISVIACSQEQARAKSRWLRPIVAFQAFWFFPLCCLQGLNWQLSGLRFVVVEKLGYPVAERIAMFGHVAVYWAMVFSLLPPLQGLLFVAVHQACFGLYMGLMFAPNHMGMPIIEGDAKLGFLEHQVRATRSIRSSRVLDYLWCGLNRQVEHHVFPTMSRNQLRVVRPWVMALCRSRCIPYHEVGPLASYGEILRALHAASTPLRPHRTGRAAVSRS